MAILRGGYGRMGLEVEVLVNGDPAKEFDGKPDGNTPESTVTKYIEAVTNAKFEIRYKVTNDHDIRYDILFELHIDGHKVDSCIYRNSIIGKELFKTCKGARIRSSQKCVRREFHFSDLATDEDRPFTQDPNALEKIGTISVKFHFIQAAAKSRKKPEKQPARKIAKKHAKKPRKSTTDRTLTEQQQVPESDLKGRSLSHFGSFGEAVPIAQYGSSNVKYVDSKHEPLGTFNFHYRSFASLKALELVPRSPSSPPPPSGSRNYEDLTHAELVEIVRLQEKQLEAIRAAMGGTAIPAPKLEPEVNPAPKREIVDDDKLSLLDAEKEKRRRQVLSGTHEVIELD